MAVDRSRCRVSLARGWLSGLNSGGVLDTRDDRITLRLEAGKVTAVEFKRAVNAFLDMISDVADEAAGRHNAVSWVVSVEAVASGQAPLRRAGSSNICAIVPAGTHARGALRAGCFTARGSLLVAGQDWT